jgi:predicted DCC family thiol-disulfide oxidoreductase YuxK
MRHDVRRIFRFAPLDSEPGRLLLSWHGVSVGGTVVVVDDGQVFVRSGAVLRVLRRLGGGWHLLRIGGLIPRRVRDALYDLVARHRGRLGGWFRTPPITAPERAADERFLA